MNKLAVIGIDGGTFDIIGPMLTRGELPNLASIMGKGSWSELTTTIPSTTIPAWVSFATGMNPGKHGVFYFLSDTHKTYDGGSVVNATYIKAKPLWQILRENDKSAIVVAVPFTYPPFEVKGVMVSNIKTAQTEKIKSHPPKIIRELRDVLKLDQMKIENARRILDSDNSKEPHLRIAELHDLAVDKIVDGTLYLMDKFDWSFLMVVFQSSDVVQHYFWCDMDKTHPHYTPARGKKYGQIIFDIYKKIDAAIGKIMQKADDRTTFIIMSDHGGGPVHKVFFTNKWLMQKGLLRLNGKKPIKIKIGMTPVQKIVTRLGLKAFLRFIPPHIRSLRIPFPVKQRLSVAEMIDWSNTIAYATNMGININMKGREPLGIVEKDKYAETVNFIKEELSKVIDPETGEKIIDNKVFRRDEIYHGPYLEDADDLYFMPKSSLYQTQKSLQSKDVVESIPRDGKHVSGHHQNLSKGIFIVGGPNIKKGVKLNPQIIDIMPTTLYLMGIKIPEDVDGRVLKEVINEDYLNKNPIKFSSVETYEVQEANCYSSEEHDQIRKHLEDLGYIG